MAAPMCGQHPIQETLAWFGEDASKLASFALVPLKHGDLGGLLVLAKAEGQLGIAHRVLQVRQRDRMA